MKSRMIILLANASLGILMSTSYVALTTTDAAGMMEELQKKLKEKEQKKTQEPTTSQQENKGEPPLPEGKERTLFSVKPTQLRSAGTKADTESKTETELEAKMRKRREWEESSTSEIQVLTGNQQEKKENNLPTGHKVHGLLPTSLNDTQNKLMGGTEATTGKLRNHDYYKRELQKLEESTQRIHREVDQILIEFRRNMEEYYQRTRGAGATTTFAKFKPQPLENNVEGGNNSPNLQLLPQEVLRPLSPAPGISVPMSPSKVPPPSMGERKKPNKAQPSTESLNPKSEEALDSGSVVSSEGLQKGLSSLKKGDDQQSARENETGIGDQLNKAFNTVNLSANTKFLHKSTLEGVEDNEWKTENNLLESKAQEQKPTTVTYTPPETNEEKLKNLEKAIAEIDAELNGVVKEGERPKLNKQLILLNKMRDNIIKEMKALPRAGSMPVIPPVKDMDEYAKEREAIRKKQDEEESWSSSSSNDED